jgi:TonB-dependent receptor
MGAMRRSMVRLVTGVVLALGLSAGAAAAQGTGRIIGRVVEAAQGAPLSGVTITLVGTTRSTTSSADGRYALVDVPEGPVSLSARLIGFTPKTVTGLVVAGGRTLEQNVSLSTKIVELQEVTVTAQQEAGSVSKALDEQRNAVAVVNSISAEQIAKSPDSDAAAAVQRVSGATVQDGRYIVVRGLGDRYTTASLNGARIPSPEPEKKVVPLDLFPAASIDGITVSKTFTPDQPGDFAGASINIRTKDFPTSNTFALSIGGGVNAVATGGSRIFAPSTEGDFLAYGSRYRRLPGVVAAQGDLSNGLDATTSNTLISSFRNTWSARTRAGSPNGSAGLSLGGTRKVFGREFGYVGSATYSYAQEVRSQQVRALALARTNGQAEEIDRFEGATGRSTAIWGGLANLSTAFGTGTKVSFNNTYNRTMDNDGRFERGFSENLSIPLEIQRLRYVERQVLSSQLATQHQIGENIILDYSGTYSKVNRSEPDRSEIVYSTNLDGSNRRWLGGSNEAAVRTFANLDERAYEGQLNLQYFFGGQGSQSALKIGGLYRDVGRDATNRAYSISLQGNLVDQDLALSPEEIFDDRFASGSAQILRLTNLAQGGSYDAADKLAAGYAMLSLPLGSRLTMVTGARVENSKVIVNSLSSTGQANTTTPTFTDLLPSLALTYRVNDNQNLRFAASRTLSRPEYRELAPLLFREVIGFDNVLGNASLKRALISNADVRWEVYPSAGEVFSVSLFAKRFTNPIERVYLGTSGTRIITFVNALGADNYGVELELRKNLGSLSESLRPVTFFSNATLNQSQIRIDQTSASVTNAERRMVGQSPYVFNSGFTWSSPSGNWSATALYNVFGERITEAGEIPLPDVVEKPRHVVDLSLRFPIAESFTARIDARNLTNAPFRFVQGPVTRERYLAGQSVSFGFSWKPGRTN